MDNTIYTTRPEEVVENAIIELKHRGLCKTGYMAKGWRADMAPCCTLGALALGGHVDPIELQDGLFAWEFGGVQQATEAVYRAITGKDVLTVARDPSDIWCVRDELTHVIAEWSDDEERTVEEVLAVLERVKEELCR